MGKLSGSTFDLDKIYDDFNENYAETAPEELMQSYQKLHDAFDDYVSALVDYEWKCGFRYAMELSGKGAVS